MFSSIITIGLGGALGAVARHGFSSFIMALTKASFPYGTLCVNVLGSFVMGVLIALFAGYWNPGKEAQLFLTTGFLGGFTTFSAFSLDAMTLMTRGDYTAAALYVGGSVAASLAAIFAGSYLAWRLMA